MDKANASRRQGRRLRVSSALIGFLALTIPARAQAITLSETEANRIGRKIWQNECNGTVAGLTSWNAGENFASLGIGHFIWYPAGAEGPFDESFPKFIAFASRNDAPLPGFLHDRGQHCPWRSRAEFLHAQASAEMRELRQFLVDTIALQSQFMVDRLDKALDKMLAEAGPEQRGKVRENFQRLLATPAGCYALVDYVNFKGEGVLHSERYRGQGWGLLQVLEEMATATLDPVQEFARAATAVLTRRVHNAPSERHESRWLAGWLNRVNSYSRD